MKLPIFSPLFQSSSNFIRTYLNIRAFLVAQTVKNPLAMQETQIQYLGQEDPLEKGMGIYSTILAWRIPRTGTWPATVDGVAGSQT